MTTPFAQVQAILAGARVPLELGGTQLLHYMLESDAGCDATVTPDRFFVQYGWHLAHHPYDHQLAPEVVSWLCEAAPSGYLAAGTLPWWFPSSDQVQRVESDGVEILTSPDVSFGRRSRLPARWAFGPRRIWCDASPVRVVLMVRDATVDPGADARPPPIEPPPVFVAGDHPCPHCGVVPERYRELRSGSLVCLACGASSTRRPVT